MKSIDMKNYAEGQVAFWTRQITFDKGQIEWTNRQLERTRKEDREQKEWAKTYNNGEYAHLYEGRYQGKETKKLLNERRRWQRDLKNAEKELARYQQMVADNTEDEEIKEEKTMTTNTTIDTSKGGTTNAFIDALTAKGYEVTKADAPNANFQCYNATITDKSGYNTITIFFGGCDATHITARVDKVNGTHKWYYGKTIPQMLAVVRQCMEGYDWTKPTKAEAIEAMDDDAEDPSVTLDEFIAKAQEIDNMKEEDTMGTTLFEVIKATAHTTDQKTIETIAHAILEVGEPSSEAKAVNATIEAMEKLGLRTAEVGDKVRMGGTTYTIAKLHYAQLFQSSYKPCSDDGWMIEFTDTNGGYHYWKQYLDGGEFIKATADNNTTTNNEEEETTMKTTTSNITIDLTEGVAKFELNGITYKYMIDSKRYAKTVDGKTTRIGKAEYEAAKAEYDQAQLDDQPSHVEVENDLDKPAVLNEFGCVDCSKCNCDKCVHRDCMRRNPKNVGGLGECPRLDNGIMGEGQKIAEEKGIEPAEAELEANARAEQKKPRKARKSKDIAYEGHGRTLTAKQVDFILHLSDTCFWENGLESTPWIDVLCDEIGGQFANKPMTVGAMVSTLCEKGLGYRAVDSLTDMATGRSHKATYFALTDLGKEIAAELGLE